MSNDKDIVITSAFRTPIGSFQGSLKDHKATELGTAVVKNVWNTLILMVQKWIQLF